MLSQSQLAGHYMDFQAFAGLRARAREDSPEALEEVARQFESLFVQSMLKSMRQAGFGDPLFDSQATGFYRDLFDKQLSLELGSGAGLGLADMLVRQLRASAAIPAESESGQALRLPRRPAPVTPAAVAPPAAEEGFADKQAFLDGLHVHAERAARRLGVDPGVLLAQAALESGWGRAVMRHEDGRSAHNLFGIKADARWEGPAVVRETREFLGGRMMRLREPFRAYESYAQSFQDYVSFLQGQSRYQDALSLAHRPEAFVRALQRAGYATDPHYADKVLRIWHRDVAGHFKLAGDAPLKAGGEI